MRGVSKQFPLMSFYIRHDNDDHILAMIGIKRPRGKPPELKLEL